MDWQKYFVHVSSFVTQEVCDQGPAYPLDTMAHIFNSVLLIGKF